MAANKQHSKGKKAPPLKKSIEQLREKHPFETDSQIMNRYGASRKRAGSDGNHQDGRGSNH